MDDVKRKVIITEKGQQIPVEAGGGVSISVYLQGDDVKEEVNVKVSDDEFATMQKQAMTNKIPTAILRDKKED